MNAQQLLDDITYITFLGRIVALGALVTTGVRPDLHDSAKLAANRCMVQAMDRIATLRQAQG